MKHSEFNPNGWLAKHGLNDQLKAISQIVNSPKTACQVWEARNQYFESGKTVEYSSVSHVFVWSFGEPDLPFLTKVGGQPYMTAEQEWPIDEDGKPLPFIGQLCFADSTDIVPVDLPGDVLLFFGRYGYMEKWVTMWNNSADNLPARSWSTIPAAFEQLPLFGNLMELKVNGRWSYRYWPNDDNEDYDEDLMYEAMLFQPWATQIGTEPNTFCRQIIPDSEAHCRSIIASFAPVQFEHSEEGSFVNCPKGFYSPGRWRGVRTPLRNIFPVGTGDGGSVIVTYDSKSKQVTCVRNGP